MLDVLKWIHSAQDPLTIVRDHIKFDDASRTLQRFADSAVRAHAAALPPPQLPVTLVVDTELEELPVAEPARLKVPKALPVAPPPSEVHKRSSRLPTAQGSVGRVRGVAGA